MQNFCDPRNTQCASDPEQYTYNYISFVSKLPILNDHVQFFEMRGPKWPTATAEFRMEIVRVDAPPGVERVNERFFVIHKYGYNGIQLFMVRSIEGPQEIELKIEMSLYRAHTLVAKAVAYIFIVVSAYTF